MAARDSTGRACPLPAGSRGIQHYKSLTTASKILTSLLVISSRPGYMSEALYVSGAYCSRKLTESSLTIMLAGFDRIILASALRPSPFTNRIKAAV